MVNSLKETKEERENLESKLSQLISNNVEEVLNQKKKLDDAIVTN